MPKLFTKVIIKTIKVAASKERVMDLCFCLQATKSLEGLDIRKPVALVVKYTNAVGILIAVPEVCKSCKTLCKSSHVNFI